MSDATKTYTIMRNVTKLAMTVKSKSYVGESIAASMPRINDMEGRPKRCNKTELNSTYITLQECTQQRLALWQKWKTKKRQNSKIKWNPKIKWKVHGQLGKYWWINEVRICKKWNEHMIKPNNILAEIHIPWNEMKTQHSVSIESAMQLQ